MDNANHSMTIFTCGDVMTGRGIDQVMPHPGDPTLHEPYIKDAKAYVRIAERANGPIPKPVDGAYLWGDGLSELERKAPDVRMINLETSITTSDDFWKGKEIHYRMHPENISSITAAGIDCCVLANNHILDWGYSGLRETLETLKAVNIKNAGAGRTVEEAEKPAILEVKGKGRVIVFSFGSTTSGIPPGWAASDRGPGVRLLRDLSSRTAQEIHEKVAGSKQKGDILIVSIHWGKNWGYEIPSEQREFAHALMNQGAVDLIHGHSSHHAKGLEVYRGKLVLYGCGDLINDYEGIGGHEHYRDDLGLMYFASLDPSTGNLLRLEMAPTQLRNFRLNRVTRADAEWLGEILNREGRPFGTRVRLDEENRLRLLWD